jgi:hypothetical protein
MGEPTTRIIKRDAVHLNGPCYADGLAARPATVRQPQVRLLERQADGAILEVQCPCGSVTRIRCDWATGSVTPPGAAKG